MLHIERTNAQRYSHTTERRLFTNGRDTKNRLTVSLRKRLHNDCQTASLYRYICLYLLGLKTYRSTVRNTQ